jgi:hypothetical protein
MNPSLSDRKPAYQLGHPFKCVCCGQLQFVPDELYDRGLRLMLCGRTRCSDVNAMVEVLQAHRIQLPAASERLERPLGRASDVTRRGDSSCREVPVSMIGESGRPVSPDELPGGGR